MPMTPRAVVTRMARTRPRRSTIGPPKIRVSASPAANAVKNSAATAAVCPWSVPHRQGEPVVRRALAELDAEHDDADEQQPPVQPAAQPLAELRSPVLRRLPGRRAPARAGSPPPSPRAAAAMRTASPMSCAEGVMPERRAGRADPRPDGGPDGPGGVHHRHEGAPGGLLDGGALDVDQHVEGADPQPDDHEGDRDQRNRTHDEREAHDRHRGGDEQQRCRDGPAAAQPVQDRGRCEQPEDGPDGHSGQEQPDRGRADAEARLDGRQPRPPRRDGDPAEPERGRDRPPPAGLRRAPGRDNGRPAIGGAVR